MIDQDYIELEIRLTRHKLNALFNMTVGDSKFETSQHEKHLLVMRYNILDQYYKILTMHLDMLEGDE